MKKDQVKSDRKEHVLDATDVPLGRLASECAVYLQGKHKPEFAPNKDVGDSVKVTNADKVKLTGRKLDQKVYHRFTGYPGGLRKITAKKLMEKDPAKLVWHAVRGMLPVNSLRKDRLKRLQIETNEAKDR